MNPDNSTDPRQALEPSLTALVLGELSDDQARFLRQTIATDPELAKTFERIKRATELIRETEIHPAEEPKTESAPLKLSDSRRQLLLQRFKTVQPEQFKQETGRRISWVAAAAAVAGILLLAAALLPALSASKSKSMARRQLSDSEHWTMARKETHSEELTRFNSRTATHGIGGVITTTEPNSIDAANMADVFKMNGVTASPAIQGGTGNSASPTSAGFAETPPAAAPAQQIFLPLGGAPEASSLAGSENRQNSLNWNLDTQPGQISGVVVPGGRSVAFDSVTSGGGGFGGRMLSSPATPERIPTLGDTPLLGRQMLSRSKSVEENLRPAQEAQIVQKQVLKEAALPLPNLQDQASASADKGALGFYFVSPAEHPAGQSANALVADSKKPATRGDSETARVELNQPVPLESALRDGFGLATSTGAADESGQKLALVEQRKEKGKAGEEPAKNELGVLAAVVEGKEKDADRLKARAGKSDRLAEGDELAKVKPVAQSILRGFYDDNASTVTNLPAPLPQPEILTRENAFSTFSLNVSDVSFRLAAASLEQGKMPNPESIRSEEFINAFDYRDPEPLAGQPVGFAWDRALNPFAQNRDLLRFSIKTAAAGRQAGKPLNVVLLLDNSGSMERADRVRIIHEALRVLAGQLQPGDKLSVVTFARTARLWVDGVAGDQAARIADELSGLTPEGGTNLEEAMNLGYQTALRHYSANGINRVVLLTDGAANLGDTDPEVLKKKVEANRKQGIALDCFGIGWEGYNDDLLEVLTRNGDGRYGFLNTPEEAATDFAGQLAGALHVAAADVKVQVEFNPGRVTSYRQIGYARHQLAKEQFRDNTVDAAEIGAAESGNALYAIETNPQGQGPIAVVHVRYKVPGTTDYHEHEWTVPFAGNAAPLEQTSAAMRLAGTAAGFAEWLAASPYAAEVTPDRLIGLLNGIPSVYGADPRPQKLEWMLRQAKAISGK